MNIQDIILRDVPNIDSSTAQMDVELLLAHAIGKSKEYVIAHPEYSLTSAELKRYDICLERRLECEPVALILGKKEFFGREFLITKDSFIPRPETEFMVERTLEYINTRKNCHVLDIGTGSGCIPVSIKCETTGCIIDACDINPKSLEIARKNATRHKVEINFFESDLLSNVSETYDVITANLPYVPDHIYENNRFLHHEPRIAITGGEDGLHFINKLLTEISGYLNRNGILLLEIHFTQVPAITETAELNNLKVTDVIQDLQGFPRIIEVKHSQ